jgi:hypothetical protein
MRLYVKEVLVRYPSVMRCVVACGLLLRYPSVMRCGVACGLLAAPKAISEADADAGQTVNGRPVSHK